MHLTLHLTARCNMRCRYCYTTHRESGDMTLEIAKAAIRLARERIDLDSPDSSMGVIFFGGEPLLMRDLITRTVRHCKEQERETGQLFHYKITTNGLLLDERFLTDPDTSEIFVALSFDGNREAHDAHRVDTAGVGTYDRLTQKIELLLKHKPYAPVMMVITPETVKNYADSVQHAYAHGFHYLICSLNYAADWTERDIAELKRQYTTLADWYYRETVKEEKFYFSPFEVKIASHVFPGSCRKDRCELGQRQISVAPDGKLYPCVQFVGDEHYSIGDVWHGIDEERRKALFDLNGEEKESCRDCAIRERCNHYCGCLNRQATGHIDRVSPVLCAHERAILPIADKLAARLYKGRNAMFIQKHYNDLFPLISLVEDTVAKREG